MNVTRTRALLVLLALAQLTCHQAILTAPLGSTILLTANPTDIAAHGGISVISALVMEETGTPVPDGTVVQFFTTLGRIQEQGRTNDGVARVNLVSDARSGTAEVSAFSGEASDGPIAIRVGAILPRRVIVTAAPSRIPSISRSTHIFATVIDDQGNPVPNVPVIFRVVSNPATEHMDSQGRPIHTDNNGRAEDVLRTRRTPGTGGTAVVEVEVLAGTASPLTGQVTIPIE